MNRIYKHPMTGQWVDEHNDLHVSTATRSTGAFEAGEAYITDRHGRIPPVKVTSTVYNAMRSACAAYNAAGIGA